MQRHNQKISILCKSHKVSLLQSGRPIESAFFKEQFLTYHGSASTSITQPFLASIENTIILSICPSTFVLTLFPFHHGTYIGPKRKEKQGFRKIWKDKAKSLIMVFLKGSTLFSIFYEGPPRSRMEISLLSCKKSEIS